MNDNSEFSEGARVRKDHTTSFLLGLTSIGVSWGFALFVMMEFEAPGSSWTTDHFWLIWAALFALFGAVTLYVLRRRDVSASGFFIAAALFLLLDGGCWAVLR